MDLKPEIHVKQTQKLVMTPQLRQAIKMLQLSNMELNERIEQELEENPALELEESENGYKNEVLDSEINSQVNNMDQSGPEGEFDKGYLYEDPSAYSADRSREDKKREFLEGAVSRAQTLKEYLREQIGLMDLEPQDYAAAEILISYIDSMGYLTADLEEISTTTGISLEELEKALQVVHSLDPPGVGARDIKECLLIQLKNKQNNPAAEKIVNECLNEIKLRKFSEISRKTGIPLAKVKEAFHIISSLEPYPGRNFFSESIEYVIPDIVVKEIDGKLEIITNNDFIPRMRVNKYYQNLLRSENVDKRVKEFVSEKLQRARGFIHSVEQRGNTLLRVTNAI
ncbi:MAG: RNA polymerase factor sigma-54, partial [Spirochaetota bacterium]